MILKKRIKFSWSILFFLLCSSAYAEEANARMVQTTLSLATPTTPQVLAVDGVSTITFTVANTGSDIADNVTITSPWIGVTFTPSSCGMIPVGGTCNFTIQTNTPNLAKQVIIQGTNTNTVTSPYVAFTLNGYLVFSAMGGVAKVIGAADTATHPVWDSSVACSGLSCKKTFAQSKTDGFYLLPSGNTFLIISGSNAIGTQDGTGGNSASTCFNIVSDNTGAVPNGTWYLPAICELGTCSPNQDNVNDNLFINTTINFPGLQTVLPYWSSSEYPSASPTIAAGAQVIHYGTPTTITPNFFKADPVTLPNQNRIRCVRTITY
jgi:hypothetical protein